MARDGATIPYSLWSDPAFLALNQAQQRVFLFSKSQAQVSYAGVVAFTLRRWSAMASDSSALRMRRDLDAVQSAGFIVVAEIAEEVLIRNFIVHERVLLQPNVAKATLKAYAAVHSSLLRAVFLLDLHALSNSPQQAGWEKGWAVLSDLLAEPFPQDLPEGFPEPFAEGFREDLPEGLPDGLPRAHAGPRLRAAAGSVLDLDPVKPCTKRTSAPPAAEPLPGCPDHDPATPASCKACRVAQRAAAAPRGIDNGANLPPEVAILRAKLDAARMFVRWDGLTGDQVAEMVALQQMHGDAPLVKAALGAFRPESPAVFAKAWLGSWRALPPPGSLRVVTAHCPVHLQDQPCRSCAGDRKAAGDGR